MDKDNDYNMDLDSPRNLPKNLFEKNAIKNGLSKISETSNIETLNYTHSRIDPQASRAIIDKQNQKR